MMTGHGRPGRRTSLAGAAFVRAAASLAVILATAVPPTTVALLAFSAPAHAEDAPGPSVRLFDRLCYSTMPDIAAVEAQADASWQPVTGADLDAYRPSVPPEVLKAWRLDPASGGYAVAISKSPMDEQSKTDFPNYADATNFACSVVLPADKTPPTAIGAGMQTLIERKPDATYEEGPWQVSSWSGGNEKLLVLLYHYAPKAGTPGGLLSMTVFQKP